MGESNEAHLDQNQSESSVDVSELCNLLGRGRLSDARPTCFVRAGRG